MFVDRVFVLILEKFLYDLANEIGRIVSSDLLQSSSNTTSTPKWLQVVQLGLAIARSNGLETLFELLASFSNVSTSVPYVC